MTIKIKLIFIFGLIHVGNGCLQNGVSNKCNCDGQNCRYCSNNLHSTDGSLDSNQSKQYSTSDPPSTSLRRKEPEHEQSQLQQLPRPTSSESLQQYPPPDNIYLPDSSLSNTEGNVEPTTTTTLYPSQEYANMIYGNNFYFKQQNSNFEGSDSPLSRPLTSEFQTNQIIDNDSYFKIPSNSDNQIPYQKLEILERPVSPYSPPPPPFEVPSNKNTFSPFEDNTNISDQIPFEKYEIEPRPDSPFPTNFPPSSPVQASEPKKPDSFNPLLVISPAISGSGLGIGILSFFKPNPVLPEIQKLRDDVFAKFDRIDQIISSNPRGMALQSDNFSSETSENNDLMKIQSNIFTEIEVKMNSLRKHFELYLNEPNQFHTNSFKYICLDSSYNPIKLMQAAESFLSSKEMDLQLENNLNSNENFENIKKIYRKVFDELILLYGHCEAVLNGPGDEAKQTKVAENLEQNFNVLLDDLNEKRLNMSNTVENSTIEDKTVSDCPDLTSARVMTTLKRKLMKEDKYPISIKWILKHDTMLGTRTIKISSFDYDIPDLPNVKYSIHLNLDKESTSTIHLGLRIPEDMKISVAEIQLSCNNNILRNSAAEYENLEGGPIYKELCAFNDLEDFIMDKEELTFIISATLTVKNAEPIEAKKPKFDKNLGYMLWESKVDKDVTIVINNENIIKAHKCVLKRRSSKFAKMLDVNAEPDTAAAATTQSTIVIQNKKFDTVKEALMHCYDIQNSDTLSSEDAANILIFAAEYEIGDLKLSMEEFCVENISFTNACLFANSALTAKSEKLKIQCQHFLSNCMISHTAVKDIEKLNAEMKETLFLQSFSTVIEN